jgi:hypothetical protein
VHCRLCAGNCQKLSTADAIAYEREGPVEGWNAIAQDVLVDELNVRLVNEGRGEPNEVATVGQGREVCGVELHTP